MKIFIAILLSVYLFFFFSSLLISLRSIVYTYKRKKSSEILYIPEVLKYILKSFLKSLIFPFKIIPLYVFTAFIKIHMWYISASLNSYKKKFKSKDSNNIDYFINSLGDKNRLYLKTNVDSITVITLGSNNTEPLLKSKSIYYETKAFKFKVKGNKIISATEIGLDLPSIIDHKRNITELEARVMHNNIVEELKQKLGES